MLIFLATTVNPMPARFFNPYLIGKFKIRIVGVENGNAQFSNGAFPILTYIPEIYNMPVINGSIPSAITNIYGPTRPLILSVRNAVNLFSNSSNNMFCNFPEFICNLNGTLTATTVRSDNASIVTNGSFLLILDVEKIS
jgi:hypothetical protein